MGKLLIIHNIITPTRTDFFNQISTGLKKKGWKVHIVFTSKTEANRNRNCDEEIKKFNFPYTILNSKKLAVGNNYFHIPFGIQSILEYENPDIILNAGRASFSVFQTLRWVRRKSKKFILWNESTDFEKSWRRVVTLPLIKILIFCSDSFVSFGTRSTEYLQKLGAKMSLIFQITNMVDSSYWENLAKNITNEGNFKNKQKMGLPENRTILFVGQLIKRKGIYELIQGYELFIRKHGKESLSLVIVGDGEEKAKIQELITTKKIPGVYIQDFCNSFELSNYYGLSSIFILPSHEEVWGLVINEALYFGLPIITSKFVGASVDIVNPGKNGVVMEAVDAKSISEAIEEIIEKGLDHTNTSHDLIKEHSFNCSGEFISFLIS